MKTSWETVKNGRTHYIHVERREVVVGSHFGTGMSDNAGTCSHEEFLEGEFQSMILNDFGEDVLNEVIKAVKKAPIYPHFLKQGREIQARKEFLDTIPIDESLKDLLKDSKTISGYSNYGNKGSYKTSIKSDTVTIFYDSTRGYVEGKDKKRIPLKFYFHASDVVELYDHFYIIGGDNLIVLSPKGNILYDSNQERVKGHVKESIFGSWLRMSRVFRNGSTIFTSYWWFNNEYNKGLLKYELKKGFTGHCELED